MTDKSKTTIELSDAANHGCGLFALACIILWAVVLVALPIKLLMWMFG